MRRPPAVRTRTYAAAGVDRRSVARSLHALLQEARYRAPPRSGRPLALPGHYAGVIRLGREAIAITTDTVGTKVLLAEELDRWTEVGEDAVAVNVNDLAALGARPAGFVDTILCAEPDARRFAAIGRGLRRGLRSAECTLLGGETAVVPDIVRGIDLGGTAIGFFPDARRPITGAGIRPGDVLIGVPSSGLHANGFTLVRRILRETSASLGRPRPGTRRPLGVELLAPTRTYTRAADDLAGRPGTVGLAHISGGGVRNLVRLHAGVRFVLDRWPTPPSLFRWIGDRGGIAPSESFQVFNMGVGFVAVVRRAAVGSSLRALARAGAPDARVIGTVARGRGVELPQFRLRYEGYG